MSKENENLELYATVTGLKHYEGSHVYKLGSVIKLIKEPENDYDSEAIACEMPYIGKKGYIANSSSTVIKGTMSAGRIYDKIEDKSFAKVKFVSKDSVIAKILSADEINTLRNENKDDEFYKV